MSANDSVELLLRSDLNLLPVLHVLIETQSTQATADRIGRTQSAVSHALGRMRELFGDELLVRHGSQLRPTPLLHELKLPLERLMYDMGLVIDHGSAFDPSTSRKSIVIASRDIALSLTQTIIAAIRDKAPNVSFRLTNQENARQRLATGEVDIIIEIYHNKTEPGQMVKHIGTAHWCFFAASEMDLPEKPSLSLWSNIPHVQVHTGPSSRSPVDDALALVKGKRSIALQVSGFLEALHVAKASQLLFTNLYEFICLPARDLNMRAYHVPLDIVPAPVFLITRATRHDSFSQWLMKVSTAPALEYFRKHSYSSNNRFS